MGDFTVDGLPLLDALAQQMGCNYLSDLKVLDHLQRAQLAHTLEQIPADTAALRDWNDTLSYLIGTPPERTQQDARSKLMQWLTALPCEE